jgi:Surface antigen variable number repeat
MCTALSLCLGAALAEAQEVATPEGNSELTRHVAGAVEPARPAPVAKIPIPGDAQLESSGVRIGNIAIKVVDVFDPENPKESGAVYRAANFLHINTRESTVRPQLLFKPGDAYSRRVLDETERNLRARRYLDEASIVPVAYHPETNTVDLLVRVHDVWTLNPGATLGRRGGVNRSGVQIDDSNLLGLGKTISVDRIQDVDRSAWKFAYHDPNLLSSRWELEAQYHDTSDGGLQSFKIDHPFYSLDTRWSASIDGLQDKRTDTRFEQGIAVDQYRTMQKVATLQGGWSTGLRHQEDAPSWVSRILLGYRVDSQSYEPDPVLGTTLLPADRRLRYPLLGVQWFQDRYDVTRNRDKIGLTEDLYVGRSLSLNVGYASQSMGSDRNAWLVDLEFNDVFHLGERQLLFADFTINGRRESGRWQGTVFTGALRYDLRQGPKRLLTVLFNHAYAANPDDSQQLYLGSDEGMRGYPLRYRSGTQRSVLNLEQRFYTDKQILRLLSVGGAAFVDVGTIRGGVMTATLNNRTFTDLGFGLRLGNIRSSRADIFHLDVAYPLNAEGNERKVQFSVRTKSSF